MRTMLRGKITLLFMMFGLLLAVPTVALAADLLTEAELSSDINARTEVAPNDTTNFDIKVWARGNVPNNTNVTGNATITNAYTMAANGTITANTGSGSTTTVTFAKNHNYGADGQTCPGTVPAQPAGVTGSGCAGDPFIVPATLVVGSVNAGTNGMLTVSAVGTNSLGTTSPATCTNSSTANDPASTPDTTDCTRDQGFVTVASSNNAPEVGTAAEDANGTEGETLTASGSFTDADGDELTLTADNSEGDFTDNGDGTWSWSFATTDDVAGGTITVTADDGTGEDNATATDDFTYSAANADPSATFNAPAQADEGSNFTLSLDDVQDPGSADTHQYNFDCGNGFDVDGWSDDSSVQCPAGDGPNTLNVGGQVRDDDGGLSAVYSDSVTVNNLPPVVTLSGPPPPSVNENKDGSENYSFTVSDPGGDTITSVSADCDADSGTDDGFLQGSQPTVSNMSFSCRFPDGPASALVKASATDDDGATGSASKTVSIANVAPTLSNLQLTNATGTACIGGNTVSITYNVADPGDDTFLLDPGVNWGDGTTNTASSHTYGPGTFTISVKGKDTDGDASNELTSDTNAVSLLYKMSGILAPFNADGNSIWKYGSTIPVKVQITDCNNTPVQGLAPKLGTSLANAATPSTTINEDVFSTSNADTGNILRYSDGIYIYNFNSKSNAITDQNATYWMSVKGFNAAGQVVTSPAQVNQKFGIRSK